jgi:hypothetical protein
MKYLERIEAIEDYVTALEARVVTLENKLFVGGTIPVPASTEDERINALRNMITKYQGMSYKKKLSYKIPALIARTPLIHTQYLRRRCSRLNCFKSGPMGISDVLDHTLKTMVEREILVEVMPDEIRNHLGARVSVSAYYKGPAW